MRQIVYSPLSWRGVLLETRIGQNNVGARRFENNDKTREIPKNDTRTRAKPCLEGCRAFTTIIHGKVAYLARTYAHRVQPNIYARQATRWEKGTTHANMSSTLRRGGDPADNSLSQPHAQKKKNRTEGSRVCMQWNCRPSAHPALCMQYIAPATSIRSMLPPPQQNMYSPKADETTTKTATTRRRDKREGKRPHKRKPNTLRHNVPTTPTFRLLDFLPPFYDPGYTMLV